MVRLYCSWHTSAPQCARSALHTSISNAWVCGTLACSRSVVVVTSAQEPGCFAQCRVSEVAVSVVERCRAMYLLPRSRQTPVLSGQFRVLQSAVVVVVPAPLQVLSSQGRLVWQAWSAVLVSWAWRRSSQRRTSAPNVAFLPSVVGMSTPTTRDNYITPRRYSLMDRTTRRRTSSRQKFRL